MILAALCTIPSLPNRCSLTSALPLLAKGRGTRCSGLSELQSTSVADLAARCVPASKSVSRCLYTLTPPKE